MVSVDATIAYGSSLRTVPIPPRFQTQRDNDKAAMSAAGKRIEAAMKAKNLELEDLATLSKVRYHALRTYVRGERVPGVFAAERIAKALGATVEALFPGAPLKQD